MFFSFPFIGEAQKNTIKQAEELFKSSNFVRALPLYDSIKKIDKKEELLFHRAICQYELGQTQNSLSNFKKVYDRNKKIKKALFYIGLCQLDLKDYTSASVWFKRYLSTKGDKIGKENLNHVLYLIERCEYALKLQHKNALAFVENMGPSVNTAYHEVNPIQSPNSQNKFYFSSNRDIATGGLRDRDGLKNDFTGYYYYDMFAVELSNGLWTAVYPFNSLQNTSRHEFIQGFNTSGAAMFFIKANKLNEGKLLVDTFSQDADKRAFPSTYNSPFFGEIGDKDLYFFNEETMFFSSKREGGYGGYDIYVSIKNGEYWSNAINLGPSINTSADEECPFVTKGASALFFSSNRKESLGGLDIFQSEIQDSTFTSPVNLGMPINSPRDDKGFFISSDGNQAVFSSNRPGGYGGHDLYLTYWKEQVLDQLKYTEDLPISFNQETISVKDSVALEESNSNLTEFFNANLYYQPNEDIISSKNKVHLDKIVDLLEVFPNLEIDIIVHTQNDNLPEFNLFFGQKRGYTVKQYLLSQSVKCRINVISAGNSYPLVSNPQSQIAHKYHNRIEFLFKGGDARHIQFFDDEITVGKNLQSEKYQSYTSAKNGLVFRIKIAQTVQMFKSDLFHSLPSIVIKNDQNLDYFVGNILTYQEARKLKEEIKKHSTAQIEILPFINFRPTHNLESHMNEYPELVEFAKYEF